MAFVSPLGNYETLAATCLIDAGVLSHKIKAREAAKTSSIENTTPLTGQEVKQLQLRLFESVQELLQAVTPPEYTLTQGLSTSIMDLTAFRYISRWEVAKAVPTEGSVTYTELATVLQVDESQLKRVLRYAMTRQVFVEKQIGEVTHTQASLLLLQEGICALNRYSTNRGFPIASAFNDALEKWGHGSQEPNQTAFNVFKNTDLAMFAYYEQNPGYATDFHRVMNFFTKTAPLSHDHIKRAFDWSSVSFSTVVDVGGSLGHCSLAILEANPTITCIVQDLPQIVTKATDPSTSIVPEHLSIMMVMHNALERDEGEWRQLFAETDSRLRLVDIRTPPGSALSLIEVVLDAATVDAQAKTETIVPEIVEETPQPVVSEYAVPRVA